MLRMLACCISTRHECATRATQHRQRNIGNATQHNALVDEPGDDGERRQLLLPGLGPHVVRRDVAGPVRPVPGPGARRVLQQAPHGAQRQVALAVRAPVAGLAMPPPVAGGRVAAAEGLLAVGAAAHRVRLTHHGGGSAHTDRDRETERQRDRETQQTNGDVGWWTCCRDPLSVCPVKRVSKCIVKPAKLLYMLSNRSK